MWFDVMAIPTDAPHPTNAHLFINFLMGSLTVPKQAKARVHASPPMGLDNTEQAADLPFGKCASEC